MMLPREEQHIGLHVCCYVWDRAVYAACDRHQRQLIHASEQQARGQGKSKLDSLRCWYVSAACCNHDGHNGLKWGSMKHISNRGLTRDVFIVIESLKNSYNVLMTNVGPWFANHLRYEDSQLSDQRRLWELLVDDKTLTDELEALQLRWEAGSLKVAARFARDANFSQTLTTVFLRMGCFQKCSDGRRATAGKHCRCLLYLLWQVCEVWWTTR